MPNNLMIIIIINRENLYICPIFLNGFFLRLSTFESVQPFVTIRMNFHVPILGDEQSII